MVLGAFSATLGGTTLTALAAQGAFIGFVSGAAGGIISGASGGEILKGALIGAITGAIAGGVLHGIEGGQLLEKLNATERALVHTVGHGVLGGASNEAMGGRFQDGFLSGLAGAAVSHVGPLKEIMAGAGDRDFGHVLGRTAIAGVVGGTTAAIGGGKFANGAVTASFQHLANAEAGRAPSPGSVDANDDGGPDPRLENAYARGLPLGEKAFIMTDYWGYFPGRCQPGRYGMVTLFNKSGEVVGSWCFNNGGEEPSSTVMIKEGEYTVSKHWSKPPNMPMGGEQYGHYPNSGNGPAYWRDKYSFKLQISGPSASPGILYHPDGANPGTHGCFGIVGNRAELENFYKNILSRAPIKMYTPHDP